MTTYITNKKARFDYEFLEQFEAGIVLSGGEVKAIRAGKASLQGAYVVVRGGEAYLVGASIAPYQEKNTPESYDREAPRKLLLTQKELARLESADSHKGLTIAAIELYNAGRNIKLKIAIARGKKQHDKREAIKARDQKRDAARDLE